jgi:hypothetical protein
MKISFPDGLLPQPPSFSKKKAYELREELGTGTFGKVVVRIRSSQSLDWRGLTCSPLLCRKLHGTFLLSRSLLQKAELLQLQIHQHQRTKPNLITRFCPLQVGLGGRRHHRPAQGRMG